LNAMDALRFRFYLARLVMGTPSIQVNLPVTKNVFAYYRDLPPTSERWQSEVGLTASYLRRLIALVREGGAPVTVTMYPYRQQMEPDAEGFLWTRDVEAYSRAASLEAGATFYSAFDDLSPLFEQGLPLYWSNDVHFTPVGQRA